MSSIHRYKLARRNIDLAALRDRQLSISLITIAVFLLCWAICLLLSFCVLSVGLVPAVNKASAVSVWTIENTSNGLIFVGLLGLAYSFCIDGAVIIILINPNFMINMNFLHLDGLGAVFILIGLARIVEVIHSCISWCAFTAIKERQPVISDIRDLDIFSSA